MRCEFVKMSINVNSRKSSIKHKAQILNNGKHSK